MKFGSIKEIVEHLKYVKIDGVSNIFRSSYLIISFVWVVLLLGNALLCAWLIKDTIIQYCKYEVTTTIRYMSEQQSTFPTIAVCNVNALSSDYAADLIRRAGLSFRELTALGTMKGNFNAYRKIQAYLKRTRGYLLTDAEKRNLTMLDDMMISCSFQEEACSAERDFEFVFHPFYLGCYRFNANGTVKMSMTGPTAELNMQFYVGLPNALDATYARGVYVFLLNSTEYPYNYATSPYMMAPGSGMTMIPQRQLYSQMPVPYSDCNTNEEDELAVPGLLRDHKLYEAVG